MTDYAKIIVYVKGGSYTLSTKNKGREVVYNFDYYGKPLNLSGKWEKKCTIEDIDSTIKQIKCTINVIFDKYLQQYSKKWNIVNRTLDFNITIEKASEQSVRWCLDNLTMSEFMNMIKEFN
jgi:hypothetical protein